MARIFSRGVAAALVVAAGPLLFISSAVAQPGPPGPSREQCQSVLPAQTVDPIVAKYRDRIRTARENLVKEERALASLLVADNSTRAALDTQMTKTNDARNAFARLRLDLLWELRSVVPAQNRELAFRCAERLLLRR